VRAYEALGDIYERQEQYEKAFDACARAFDLRKASGNVQELQKKMEKLRKLSAERLHTEGLERYREGKEKQAILLWTQALKRFPGLVQALRDRGLTYHRLGKYDKAFEDFTEALELEPSNAEIYRVRADTFYRMKKPEKALQDYNKALELNPKDAIGYNNRGLVYHEDNELDKALADYSKAISLDSSNPTFFENRALVNLSKGRKKEAASDFRRALDLTKDDKRRRGIQERISSLEEEVDERRPGSPSDIPELDQFRGASAAKRKER
jgi:tetratricopeptide (TPR) repeat protein